MKVRILQVALWLLAVLVSPVGARAGEPQEPGQQPEQPVPAQPVPAEPEQPLPADVRRPYRGLFAEPARGTRSLIASGSVFAAYDDDVYGDQIGTGPSFVKSLREDGVYAGFRAGLDYARSGRVFGSAGTEIGVNHYSGSGPLAAYRGSGTLGLNTGRTVLSGFASMVYSPQFRLSVFVDPLNAGSIADPFQSVHGDFDLYSLKAFRATLGGNASRSIGRRSSLSGFYTHTNILYVDSPFDYETETGGGLFTHGVSRHLTLRAGYSYSAARYSALLPVPTRDVHNLDVGVDYSRALSISRRTRFGFSTGSAVLSTDASGDNRDGNDLSYRFTGSANLTHEMGRTWTADLTYRRSVDYHEGFYDPFLSDGVGLSIGGFFSRRTRFSSVANYSFGTVGFGSDNHFVATTATAELQRAISRRLAAFVSYFFYQHDFDEPAALNPQFAQSLDRQGIRVGLSASVPLIR